MAVDMFLILDGIDGESQDSVHAGKIDILAWSWGVSNSSSFHMGSGGGAGKSNFQDISLTKYVDKSSSVLLKNVSDGTHIESGSIIVRKAGTTQLEYITIELKKVFVTSVSMGGSGGEDRLTENITLNFQEFKYIYKEQMADGTEGAAPEFAWNIAQVVAV